ncbi:MAG TPA: hypothetical protein VGM96_23595 [Reyranella sp.]
MSAKAKTALALAGLLAGCLQQPDPAYLPAYLPVSLPAPYSDLPDAPQGTPIEPGMPIKLEPRQQEAVVSSVSKWMKEPGTVSFGALNAVKARQGQIVVCGEVNGRNSAGTYPGMAPFVGIMVGKPAAPEFIVISIAQSGQPRAEIQAICQQSGIF